MALMSTVIGLGLPAQEAAQERLGLVVAPVGDQGLGAREGLLGEDLLGLLQALAVELPEVVVGVLGLSGERQGREKEE